MSWTWDLLVQMLGKSSSSIFSQMVDLPSVIYPQKKQTKSKFSDPLGSVLPNRDPALKPPKQMGRSLNFTPWGHDGYNPPPKFGSTKFGRMLHLKENGHYLWPGKGERFSPILEMLHPQKKSMGLVYLSTFTKRINQIDAITIHPFGCRYNLRSQTNEIRSEGKTRIFDTM